MNVQELIRSVNARIPSSVTPETRIEVHPSEWLALVDAAQTPNENPLKCPKCKSDNTVAGAPYWRSGDEVCAEAWVKCDCEHEFTIALKPTHETCEPTPQKAGGQPPGDCNRRGLPGDPCDKNCNWPECGCVPDGKGAMRAATASLLGDRAVFKLTLERHMHAVVGELDWLIGLHDQWGDSMQKHSLHKARSVLKGGIDWFAWERRRNRG